MDLTKSSDNANPAPIDSIDIWFADIPEETTSIEQRTEVLLSDSEKARLSATKSPLKRREFLLSRALMRHGLTHRFGQDEGFWIFQTKRNHAPEITNLPQPVYTSLSHSKGLIGFAISETPVGLDLEIVNMKRNIDALAEVTMTQDEIYYLNQHPADKVLNFHELWCCKEAYYKSVSSLNQASIRFSNLSIMRMGNDTRSRHFLLNNIGDYVVAIATSVWPISIKQKIFQTENNNKLELLLQESTANYYRLSQKDEF